LKELQGAWGLKLHPKEYYEEKKQKVFKFQ
jgi:hypothetical protein